MASEVPKPRSFQQILADIYNTFAARSGIRKLKVGSAILTSLEAAAQSDLRSTQDVFNALDLRDITRTFGAALDFAAKDDGITRLAALAATGSVDIYDPTITRIATKIYSGTVAPVAGSSVIRVVDATDFPSSGTIYIGRGTTNVEGPIPYSAKTQLVGYWTLTLTTPTARFHNLNEDVVLGQKGDRPISSGTTVSTQRDARSNQIEYSTAATATILDGEVVTYGVPVVCQQTGTVGNVPSGSITSFTSAPFAGATCSNPSPLTSGQDIETDEQLQQRLILVRSSKSRGTDFAILSNAAGVFSQDENKRVVSTSIVTPAGAPSVLYIDDGTGYEEATSGIPYEVLVDQASGGEEYFSLSGRRPIAKAFVKTTLSGPYALVAGCKLSVKVGGVISEHSFDSSDFTAITSALPVEVVSSINSNPSILFSARTADNGTKVSIFARSETEEDVEVITPSSGTDANTFLGFTTDVAYTLKLYKNDRLLYKDGRKAIINSAAQSSWGTMTSPMKVNISVDGTPGVDYTFSDVDFVAANTAYTTLSKNNSIASWAAVFNSKVPGITATDGGGYMVLTSNRNESSQAAITIAPPSSGSSLITAGMFTASSGLESSGLDKDFTLNRNTGQIKLFTPLVAGDSLTVGSFNTRAFIQSQAFTSGSVTFPSVARLWLAVDGQTENIVPGTTAATTYSVNQTTGTYTFSPSLVSNPVIAGDYAIVYDTALSVHGAFRVISSSTSTFVLRHNVDTANQVGVSLISNGLRFVRTSSFVQEVRIPAGSQTLDALVSILNDQLVGAKASVYRGKYLRITTDSYRNGDIMLVGADSSGQSLGFPLGTLATDSQPHLPSLLAGSTEISVPQFDQVARLLTDGSNQAPPQFTSNLATPALPSYPPTSFPISPTVEGGRPILGLAFNEASSDISYISHFMNRHRDLLSRESTQSSFTLRQKQSASARIQGAIAIGGLVRTGGSTVTATLSLSHSLKAGDVVVLAPTGTPDAIFPAGKYVVTSTPSSTSFTFTKSGANVASVQPYGVNLWDDMEQEAAASWDLFVPTNPYAIGAYDTLNVTMDDDPVSLNYNVPMYRNVLFTGTPGGTLNVKDADNSNQNLSVGFGTSEFFNDFWVHMQPKTVSHLGVANKDILWKFAKYGPQGNLWTVAYDYPSQASAAISYGIQNGTNLRLKMPSGSARTGLSLDNKMAFTSTNVASLGGRSVTISYAAVSIFTISRAGSTVTVSLSSPMPTIIGQVVYIAGVPGVDFPPGPKIVTFGSTSTFQYSETGLTVSTGGGTASYTSFGPNFTSVVVNDVVNFNVNDSNWRYNGSFRVTAIPTATSLTFFVPDSTKTSAMTTPVQIGDTSAISIYPINSANSKANDYITFAGASFGALVSASNYAGTGIGTITVSTEDEYASSVVNFNGASVSSFAFRDGLNYVKISNLTSNPNTISFKQPVSGTYTSSWTDEPARLVPTGADTISRWLMSSAVTGLVEKALSLSSGNDGTLQVSSLKPGDLGGVTFTSNQLNGQTVPVSGAGDTALGKINFNKALEGSLVCGSWVYLENTDSTVQALPITGTDTITLAGDGTVTFSVSVNTATSQGPSNGSLVGVTKVGNYAIVMHQGATAWSSEGNYLKMSWLNGSAANSGTFRIIRSGTVGVPAGNTIKYVWIENPNAITEKFTRDASDVCLSYTPTSVMPGDIFEIAYDVGGFSSNIGQYEVQSTTANSGIFKVNGTFTPVGATPIGSANVNQLRIVKQPLKLFKRLVSIGVDPDSPIDPTLPGTSWAIFDSNVLLSGISSTLGGFMGQLSRLDFSTQPFIGANGYNVNTGLISEVNRVLYGDLNAPSIYPGVVADGSNLNISGPNIKRIQVSLQLRLRTGVSESSALDRVRNAVTTAINSIPLGQPVDISRVVAAARGVSGVSAVSVLSPTYAASSDLIPVQSNEKPFVFVPETDIQLSVVE